MVLADAKSSSPAHRFFPAWAWVGIGLLAVSPLAGALETGAAAPGFELAGLTAPVRQADFAGKTLYVDFWASWCGPCKQSFPWMNAMQARYGSQGLQVVAVNLDKRREDAMKFLQSHPAGFAVAFDAAGSVPRAWEVKTMPTSFLVTPDGRLHRIHPGFHPDEQAQREQHIREALGLR